MVNWRDIHGNAFAGKRVLITGGAGFIGSHLVRALAELDASPIALDDLSAGSWENLAGARGTIPQIHGSITDKLQGSMADCEYVFHHAALGSVPASLKEPDRYYQVNVIGTVNVLGAAAAAGVKRVIFAASSSAYGDAPTPGPKVETMLPLPISPYAATKVAGEHAMRAWSHSLGLDTVSLRYFNIFGPRQNPDSAYAAVIAAFAKAFARGEAATIFGDGQQTRDFTYVDNVVGANLLAALHPRPLQGEVLNIAVGGKVTVNDLYRKMAQLYGLKNIQPKYQPPRAGDVRDSQADISKAKAVLGYQPLVNFDRGLAETVKWYREHLDR